jgi:hypothetical protein
MNDPVSTARTARANLARGLSALQGPGVPEALMAVAEPVAEAMSNLHHIESTQAAPDKKRRPRFSRCDARWNAAGPAQRRACCRSSGEAIAGSLSPRANRRRRQAAQARPGAMPAPVPAPRK